MADITVTVELPTTREKGGALKVEDIDRWILEMSADGGVNYVVVDEFEPSVLETVVPELEHGTWFFRGSVRDAFGQMSKPVVESKVINDTSPPNSLVKLTLA